MKVYDIDHNIILETDKNIELYDVLKIKGQLYTIVIEHRNGDVTVEPFEFRTEVDDLLIEQEAVCPYCAAIHRNIRNDKDIYKCDVCSSDFSYSREVTVEYWTKPIKKNDRVVEL